LDGAEIARLIEELETRVERLRALYDQYFVGIERLEPLVLRKDVDRRLWVLRREQIRNTALRFKLETTFQRYNTYQQYWQRIVREIENGTYQRDLGRAARRFGEGAVTAFGKRRQKMFEKGAAKRAEREAARRGSSTPAPVESSAPPAEGVHSSRAPDALRSSSRALGRSEPTSGRPPSGSDAYATRPGRPENEPDFEGWDVPMDLELELGSSRPPPPPPLAPVRPLPDVRQAALPQIAPLPLASGAADTAPPKSTPAAASSSRAEAADHAPRRRTVPPPLPKQTDARIAHAAAKGHAPKAPQPKTPEPAKATDGELSATRLRQIYGQYVEAKRKANESTAALTFDKVAANLRQTAKDLRAKHGSKGVDFEVVLKNGKPAIKPIVKG